MMDNDFPCMVAWDGDDTREFSYSYRNEDPKARSGTAHIGTSGKPVKYLNWVRLYNYIAISIPAESATH